MEKWESEHSGCDDQTPSLAAQGTAKPTAKMRGVRRLSGAHPASVRCCCQRSAVGFAAVEDGVDAKRVGMLFGEAHAVVADAQAQFAGLSLEFLHIAFAGLSEAVQRGEDAHSGLAIDTANVSLSGDGKDNFLHASIVTA